MSEAIQKHEVHQPMFEIEGAPIVYIREGRILNKERHENLYYYDMRHGDSDWSVPISIEKGVMVNFFGTLVSVNPIEILEIDNSNNSKWIEVDPQLEELIIDHRC